MRASGSCRITPAWAGKRKFERKVVTDYEDHPRVGGEKVHLHTFGPRNTGSPPRGRGKVPSVISADTVERITPAWAGKRRRVLVKLAASRDHPRVGGEKPFGRTSRGPRKGSPPRGRGKAHLSTKVLSRKGITPAWAGKRLKRSHRSGIFISGPIPFHSVLHRPAGSGSSRAGRDGSPAGQPQNAGPA